MNEYEVIIKTSRTYVHLLTADTEKEAEAEARQRYDDGYDGESLAEVIESVVVEKP